MSPPNSDYDDFTAQQSNLAAMLRPAAPPAPNSPLLGNAGYQALAGGAQGVAQSQAALQKVLAQKQAAQQPAVDKFNAATNAPPPAPPQQQQIGAPPEMKKFGEDAQNWTLAMAALAAVAGAFSRQHATTALNAFGSGIKGYQQGNQQAFEDAFKTWKGATDAAIDNNKQLTDKYKAILDNRDLTENEAVQQMKMVGLEYQDSVMAAVDTLDHSVAVYNSQLKANEKATTDTQKMQEWKDKVDYTFQQKEKAKKDQQEANDLRYAAWSKTPEAIGAADAYAKGVPIAEIVRGRGNVAEDEFQNIKKLAFERHPNLDLSAATVGYAGEKREAAALATRSAPAKVAVKEMDALAEPMIDAVSKLNPTQFPDMNSLNNAYQKRTGGADVVKAALAVQEFKTAFTNLMVRNGVPTDAARGKADELMDKNFSLDQIKGVVEQAKVSGAAVLDALAETKKSITSDTKTPSAGAPAGVDPSLWQHMTPEEKALWQTPSP